MVDLTKVNALPLLKSDLNIYVNNVNLLDRKNNLTSWRLDPINFSYKISPHSSNNNIYLPIDYSPESDFYFESSDLKSEFNKFNTNSGKEKGFNVREDPILNLLLPLTHEIGHVYLSDYLNKEHLNSLFVNFH